MKNLDAYHDGLMHAFNDAYEYEPPWKVVEYEDVGDGYIVIDEFGIEDEMGFVFDTYREAKKYADELNKEALKGDDEHYD